MATSPKRMRHEFSIDSLVADRPPHHVTPPRPLPIPSMTSARALVRSPSAKSDASSNGSPPRHPRSALKPEARLAASPNDYAAMTSLSSPLAPHFPHPAFMGAGTTLTPGSTPGRLLHPTALPPLHGLLSASGAPPIGANTLPPGLAAAQMASLAAHAQEHSRSLNGLLPGGLNPPQSLPNPHQLAAMFPGGLPPSVNPASLAAKESLPLYTWLLARQNSYLSPGLTGKCIESLHQKHP